MQRRGRHRGQRRIRAASPHQDQDQAQFSDTYAVSIRAAYNAVPNQQGRAVGATEGRGGAVGLPLGCKLAPSLCPAGGTGEWAICRVIRPHETLSVGIPPALRFRRYTLRCR